jgi:hypothetical protein
VNKLMIFMYLFVAYLTLRSVTDYMTWNDRITSEEGIRKDVEETGVAHVKVLS